MPPRALTKAPPKQFQLHLRLDEALIKLIDERAAFFEREMQKVLPGAKVSRAEAAQALIKQALAG